MVPVNGDNGKGISPYYQRKIAKETEEAIDKVIASCIPGGAGKKMRQIVALVTLSGFVETLKAAVEAKAWMTHIQMQEHIAELLGGTEELTPDMLEYVAKVQELIGKPGVVARETTTRELKMSEEAAAILGTPQF